MSKRKRRVLHRAPEIAVRDGGWFCRYCGIALIPHGTPFGDQRYWQGVEPQPERIFEIRDGYAECEVDHLQPKSRGGNDDIDNLALACVDCNQVKGRLTAAEFVEWRAKRGN